jgi:hypothetical protein
VGDSAARSLPLSLCLSLSVSLPLTTTAKPTVKSRRSAFTHALIPLSGSSADAQNCEPAHRAGQREGKREGPRQRQRQRQRQRDETEAEAEAEAEAEVEAETEILTCISNARIALLPDRGIQQLH